MNRTVLNLLALGHLDTPFRHPRKVQILALRVTVLEVLPTTNNVQ
jgi:hypothetical protein